MRYLAIVILFMCVVTTQAQPLDPNKELSQYNIDHWQDESTPSSIMQIIQASDGYLWMSTLKGLARFDGLKLNVYDKFTSAALDVNGFKSLYEDKNGNFWVGSIGEGLYLKQGQTFKKFTVPFGTSSNNIERIFTDSRGTLWLCTVKGIIQFRDSIFTLITPDGVSRESDFPTFDITESKDGTLWVASATGLYTVTESKLTRAFADERSLNGEIVDLHIDSEGGLWIAAYNNGFFFISDTGVKRIGELDQLKHPIVVYEDRQKNLWFGSEHGIARRSVNGFSYLTSARGLSHDHITAICEDHEGSIWLGSYYGGINRLRDGTFTNYSTANGLPHETTHVLLETADKTIWAGTETDLAYLKDGHFNTLSEKFPILAKARVRGLMEDKSGSLWIASYDGVFKMTKNKMLVKYDVNSGLTNNQTRVLYEDRNNNIWVGTRQGLNLLKDGRWRSFGPREGLLNDFVMSIIELRNGKFLVATTGGLYILKGETFEPVTTDHGNLTLTIFRMLEDDKERLWIGTSDGLLMLDGNTLTDYSHHHKILSSNIYQILEDDNNFLWLTSDLGIARIEKEKLLEKQLHDTTSVNIRI
ncbi:MAG TPA: two-component regulator propeller domain-containing protein, partial [Chryseosolibacter sp.]|nr:two-component regulator propeller domain-containing protein [Chryseosolibacter sp.]